MTVNQRERQVSILLAALFLCSLNIIHPVFVCSSVHHGLDLPRREKTPAVEAAPVELGFIEDFAVVPTVIVIESSFCLVNPAVVIPGKIP